MKVKRKSDGKIIEVKDWSGRRELYSDPDMNHFYQVEDLDFLPEKETAVLEEWVARDEDGFISMYQNKPARDEYDCQGFWHDDNSGSHIELPTDSFPLRDVGIRA